MLMVLSTSMQLGLASTIACCAVVSIMVIVQRVLTPASIVFFSVPGPAVVGCGLLTGWSVFNLRISTSVKVGCRLVHLTKVLTATMGKAIGRLAIVVDHLTLIVL